AISPAFGLYLARTINQNCNLHSLSLAKYFIPPILSGLLLLYVCPRYVCTAKRACIRICRKGDPTMSIVRTKDGAEIYYKDWGDGQPVVFSHGWPLSSEAWASQMFFLAQHGYRVIAHDRRGHGRSSQTSSHNDMNSYADDLAAVIDHLDLNNAVLVGHSTGGG